MAHRPTDAGSSGRELIDFIHAARKIDDEYQDSPRGNAFHPRPVCQFRKDTIAGGAP